MGDPKDFQLRNTLYQPPGKELHYDGLHDAEVPMGPLESLAARSKQGSTSPVQRVGLGGTRAADAGGYATQAKPRAMTPEQLMQAANEMMDHTHAQHVMLRHGSLEHPSGTPENGYNTDPKGGFAEWKQRTAPNDSGEDYDLAGAYNAGEGPGPDGHFTDRFKKPNHETFSDESQYADYEPGKAGSWDEDNYRPSGTKRPRWLDDYMGSDD